MSDNTIHQPPVNNRLVLLGTLLVGIVATFVVLYALTNRPRTLGTPTVDLSENYDGVQAISPPQNLQDFTLIDQTGKPTSLSDYRGKMVLMFFGFTNCEDICPITLFQFQQIRQKLGDQANQMAFLFISVDPQRDTPAVIGDYLTRFDPSITGLAGDIKVFEQIKNDYDLQFIKVPREGSTTQTDYSVSHTPNPFLIDRDGKLVARYAYGTNIGLMVSDISQRLGA